MGQTVDSIPEQILSCMRTNISPTHFSLCLHIWLWAHCLQSSLFAHLVSHTSKNGEYSTCSFLVWYFLAGHWHSKSQWPFSICCEQSKDDCHVTPIAHVYSYWMKWQSQESCPLHVVTYICFMHFHEFSCDWQWTGFYHINVHFLKIFS